MASLSRETKPQGRMYPAKIEPDLHGIVVVIEVKPNRCRVCRLLTISTVLDSRKAGKVGHMFHSRSGCCVNMGYYCEILFSSSVSMLVKSTTLNSYIHI